MHHLPLEMGRLAALAAATVAGHLIECGAQATGGLWCNYQEAAELANVGYPIVVVEPDGNFTITKPPGTGGAVLIETIAEQLLYEVGDPAAYLTPDVSGDFTSVTLEQVRPDVVRVNTTRGQPATDSYKVSIAYRDGFAASGTLTILGPDAPMKAALCGDMIRERLRRVNIDPEHWQVEVLGTGACVPGVLPEVPAPPEVVLRVTIRDARRTVLDRFVKEFAPLVTSGPPGVTGYTTGRPAVREVFAYWPAAGFQSCRLAQGDPPMNPSLRLLDIAHGRSGDKGNHANIAVIAYTAAGYAWLCENLSADLVRDYFQSMKPSSVIRYEAPQRARPELCPLRRLGRRRPAGLCGLIRKGRRLHWLCCKSLWSGRRIMERCCDKEQNK